MTPVPTHGGSTTTTSAVGQSTGVVKDILTDPAPMASPGSTGLTQARSCGFLPPSSNPGSNSKAFVSARNAISPAVPSVQQSAGVSQFHFTQSFQSPSSQGSVTRFSPPLPSGNGATNGGSEGIIVIRRGFGFDVAPPSLSSGIIDDTGKENNGRGGLPRIVKNVGLEVTGGTAVGAGVTSARTSASVQVAPTQASYIESGIHGRDSGLNKGGNGVSSKDRNGMTESSPLLYTPKVTTPAGAKSNPITQNSPHPPAGLTSTPPYTPKAHPSSKTPLSSPVKPSGTTVLSASSSPVFTTPAGMTALASQSAAASHSSHASSILTLLTDNNTCAAAPTALGDNAGSTIATAPVVVPGSKIVTTDAQGYAFISLSCVRFLLYWEMKNDGHIGCFCTPNNGNQGSTCVNHGHLFDCS
ncbi:hypothetical protein JB92DRAFT_763995 [Gautieria morchelliformis]|nr:hypothetical protein JB92DRAFT_763995 [Gautieria morchelliformis]